MWRKPVKDMDIYEKTERVCELLAEEEAVSGEFSRAENLRRKLQEKDMTVAVIGQFKRGKSAVTNSILRDKMARRRARSGSWRPSAGRGGG